MFLSEQERQETMRACRYCPMCYVADRVASVIRRESYSPRGRGAILFGLERGVLEWDEAVSDIMYTTLNDGLIQGWCVGHYDHEELVIDARSRLFERGLAPESVVSYVSELRRRRSPGRSPREVLGEAAVETRDGSPVLLYSGCTGRQDEQESLAAMGRLFNGAGVGFGVLHEEPCCGWPLYQLGDLGGAQDFSVKLSQAIRASGARQVVVLDGDCYRMLLTRTRRFGGELEGVKIVHAVEVLAEWIRAGQLKIRERKSLPVTYHDPCALARYCEDLDSPRWILSAILEEPPREMRSWGKGANCCGAGGMLAVHRPEVSEAVSRMRLQEARQTGAELLVTACPRCDATFKKAPPSPGDPRIANIVQLVAQAAGLA
jgi:Fe-S oxidoreductase